MSLFSSVVNAFSGQQAAKAQKRAADAANNTIKQQYEQTRSDLQPYRQSGTNALSRYGDLLGMNGQESYSKALEGYTQSPFLAQMVQNTQKGVDASSAARGGLFSGATAQAIGDRTGQLYLQDFNNYLGRLGGMADSGQNAAAQTGQFGAQAAAQRGQYYTDRGNANANSIMAPALGMQQFTNNVSKAMGAYAGGGFG